jgi:hypothetical protein
MISLVPAREGMYTHKLYICMYRCKYGTLVYICMCAYLCVRKSTHRHTYVYVYVDVYAHRYSFGDLYVRL